MAHAPKGTKRKNTFHEDTEEPDHRRAICSSQQAASRLRAAKERLQRLQQEAAAVRETEATLSKKVKETEESLIQEAVSQLRDGRKPQSLKWERLVALTAKWRYANNDQSIGSCADLKRSLSFAASLRLARHVTWTQWRAVENDPQHIEEVLSLCSQGCQQELDVDWGPYRFCLARQLPELVPSFLLERTVEAWSVAGRFAAQDFITAAVQTSAGYSWTCPDPPSTIAHVDQGSSESHEYDARQVPTEQGIPLCPPAAVPDFTTYWKHNYDWEQVARHFSVDPLMHQCITSSHMWQRERSDSLRLSYCMTGASPLKPGDVHLTFTIGFNEWLHLIGVPHCGMTGVFSPDQESTRRIADMLPSLRDGIMSSQHWYLSQQCLTFTTSVLGDDVLMEVWSGGEVGLCLLQDVSTWGS